VLTRYARIGLVLAVSAAFVASASGAPAQDPAVPAIYVNYNVDCTFTMTVDGGTSLTPSSAPGSTLPPGPYQLLVFMPNPPEGAYTRLCEIPKFKLSGPGVSSEVVFDGEELHEHLRPVLQPSSTYVAEDENAPGQTRRVFTTAPSGSSGALVGSGGGGQSGPTKGSVQSELVGSAILRYRGKLAATVSAAGKATLERAGRSVGSLKAGRYDIAVEDGAARAGFFVQRGTRKAVVVTSLAFVGKRTQRVSLGAGKWTFFSKVGKPTQFTVVA
jgi:hypothetical protein